MSEKTEPLPSMSVSTPLTPKEIRLAVLISEAELQARIQAMAAEINRTYAGTRKLIMVGILKGAFLFMADLVRHLTVPCHIEFIRLASYGDEMKSSGTVRSVDLSLPDLTDEDVLLVEDIVDTGLTVNFLLDYLHALQKTKSLRMAVLLEKPEARLPDCHFKIDFTGFQVGQEFLVGYGLDYCGFYRNLPYIAKVQE